MIPGEITGMQPSTTCTCGNVLKLEVLRSAAGYYLGYFCGGCGPYSRESGYYGTRKEAETDLDIVLKGEFNPAITFKARE